MAPMGEEENPAGSVATGRSKREKSSKATKRAELLARIKRGRETGEKVVQEETDDLIYDEVDETEYSDIVRKRQEDDWIVEDGTGYKDDGREIFDEEYSDDEDMYGGRKKGKKSKNPNIRKPGSAPGNIKAMFAASAGRAKPKSKEVTAHDDAIMEELLAGIEGGESSSQPPVVKPGMKRKQPLALFTKKPQPSRRTMMKKEPLNSEGESQDMMSHSMSTDDTTVIPDSYEEEFVPPSQPIGEKTEAFDEMDDDGLLLDTKVKAEPEVKPDIKLKLSDSWMVNESADLSVPDDCQVSSENLPLVTNDAGEKVFRFYWLDAHEDYFRHPGTVYLFGKTKTESGSFVSCCVCVKNISRHMFFLPRQTRFDMKLKGDTGEEVQDGDVYREFNEEIARKYRIQSFKAKMSAMQYAFEIPDVPATASYLEVIYGCEFPALPSDLSGSTFSHVFGANKSSLETFLLQRKIKGPAWLDISLPSGSNHSMSWCKLDVLVSDYKTISVTKGDNLPAPPLITLTINVKSQCNAKTHQNEVTQIAGLVNNEYFVDKPPPEKLFHNHFLAVTKPGDLVFPFDLETRVQTEGKQLKMELLPSERALLGFLLAKIHKYDPDIIIGHDVSHFELDLILNRIAIAKVPHWHKISRLKRSGDIPRRGMGKSSQIDPSATCGRIICDTMISARELIRAKSYDLTEIVSQVLRQKREELDADQLRIAYGDTTELLRVANLTIQDAFYAHKIMFELNVLPLAWQITNICGNVLSRTLLGGRSERNEYLLLHAFTEKGFIPPDKSYGSKSKHDKAKQRAPDDEHDESEVTKGKRKPAYAGGLVLEPKKGFYDTFILLLDFNSLYPSIIQEYNVCFTTVSREHLESELAIPDLPDSKLPPGVLPVEIRKLVQSRKQVKVLMKEAGISQEQYMQYDIRQKALKLTANSMYGCLGFTFSRFYAKPLAALITAKGREILQKTKELVEKQGLEVIYGDTDSIMINTNSRNIDEVFKLGNKVKQEVNKAYRLLEIDIDGVYKSLLLLKKKKYAALNVSKGADGKLTTTQELKGLDIVRRDWCELAKQTGLYVVNEILSGESKETVLENIHNKLREVKEAVTQGEIPLDLYYITKQLTKAPEAYPDKKSLPHVQVALRLNVSANKKMRAGDTVYYVICQDGTTMSASQRAYHPDELAKNDKLKVDTEYYLSHQIHPVVCRLCDPIEGTDAALIAEMLGLDGSRYHHKAPEEEEDVSGKLLSEEERYKDCNRLEIRCVTCHKDNIITTPFRLHQHLTQDKPEYVPSWLYCCSIHTHEVKDRLGKTKQVNDAVSHLQLCNKENNPISIIKNKLANGIREHIDKYYQGWLRCEDFACNYRTRRVPLHLYRGRPVCQQCKKSVLVQEYTESMLYDQLCFYSFLFDLSKKPAMTVKMSEPMVEFYREISDYINERLHHSAYGHIDLGKLFAKLTTRRTTVSRS